MNGYCVCEVATSEKQKTATAEVSSVCCMRSRFPILQKERRRIVPYLIFPIRQIRNAALRGQIPLHCCSALTINNYIHSDACMMLDAWATANMGDRWRSCLPFCERHLRSSVRVKSLFLERVSEMKSDIYGLKESADKTLSHMYLIQPLK